MKKLMILFALLLLASPVMADNSVIPITASGVTVGTTAVAAGHAYSPLDIPVYGAANGYFALQGTITGDGTCKIEYWTSLDNVTYREPTGATDIISSFTKTSGPNSDGKFYIQFFPDFCKHLRIVVTETGGVSTVTPNISMVWK